MTPSTTPPNLLLIPTGLLLVALLALSGWQPYDRATWLMEVAPVVIFLLADEGLRNRMGMSGRDYVRSQYSKERLIRDIENLYRNLR